MIAKKAFNSSKSLPSPPSILISYFSTSTQAHHQPFQTRRHQQEEESRGVKISVWWDFENCHPPTGANAFRVSQMITAAVRANGMKGPVQITAFGDVSQLSRPNQEALSSTGISMTHVPNGGKNSADRSLLVDLMYWVSQNPPPAHLFLISSDRDFASTLHRLRMNNYNILLASKETAPGVLCSAASIMWQWNELVKGENLTGKYFNQPPDGPYGSWYGHYKLPLEDPFAVAEPPPPPPSPKVKESVDSETRIHPIPKGLKKLIRLILSSYPEGMPISDLHRELLRKNVGIDKKFYGHMKFSSFLLAMPHVLKLRNMGDDQLHAHLVDAKGLESPEPLNNVNPLPSNSSKREDTNREAENLPSSERKIGLPEKEAQEPRLQPARAVNGKESTIPVVEKVLRKSNALETDKQTSRVRKEEQVSEKPSAEETDEQFSPTKIAKGQEFEGGFFNTIRRIWSGSSKKETEGSAEIPNNKLGGEADNKKKLASSCSKPNVSEASSESLTEKSASNSEISREDSSGSPGLISRMKNWWKSRGTSFESLGKQPTEILDQRNVGALNHELYSKDSFWSEMEPFIRTQKGSLAITESKSREQMATNLQNEGPLVLKSLKESDLLQLVDILISEKKWVDECPSEASPFKVTLSVDNAAPNGPRSSFLKEPLLPASDLKSFERSRSEILIDCRILAQEIVKEFPDGYNIGTFRKEFFHSFLQRTTMDQMHLMS
ncbi:Meiosis regulator and mRNA stability factor 1 [Linum grandiflorum]